MMVGVTAGYKIIYDLICGILTILQRRAIKQLQK